MSLQVILYLVSISLLTLAAYVVFRVIVRRDYMRKGRLTWISSLLELLIWGFYLSIPYIYNPPQWVNFWSREVPVSPALRTMGLICVVLGMASAFGSMIWFGLRRAFGLEVKGLIQMGPYRITRNPQLVGGVLMVIGMTVLWPSWYALGWVVLYGVVSHLMVITEEEHLRTVYGKEYEGYCQKVPRYLGL